MMNWLEAIEFARASAREAIDQASAYEDPIGSFRDNVVDTLNDEHADEFTMRDALDAFDAEIKRLKP